jgi:hypothetical protein
MLGFDRLYVADNAILFIDFLRRCYNFSQHIAPQEMFGRQLQLTSRQRCCALQHPLLAKQATARLR